MSLTAYYGVIPNLWDEQDLYQPISEDMTKQREEARAVQFLASLGPEYDSIKDQLMTSEELLHR